MIKTRRQTLSVLSLRSIGGRDFLPLPGRYLRRSHLQAPGGREGPRDRVPVLQWRDLQRARAHSVRDLENRRGKCAALQPECQYAPEPGSGQVAEDLRRCRVERPSNHRIRRAPLRIAGDIMQANMIALIARHTKHHLNAGLSARIDSRTKATEAETCFSSNPCKTSGRRLWFAAAARAAGVVASAAT